ncbi:DNA starvation/stationary phase protection protein [Porifericola rhodea]|uniref:Dps family protein n=1 Tax=Porifericola rhodea TaxID=930972 RepID=UPI002665E988|nr:DNA starvation/stationary phase protection protein [Porifericola rhodea]WKN31237.1 DNA starvation/stationary phase protection protein [Porifericola rhodea]
MSKLVKNDVKSSEPTKLGLSENKRAESAEILNLLLADASVLYTKTRNFHWNVTGPLFYSLHNLLEEQYQELATSTDEIAERVRQLGFNAVGSMQEFLNITRLEEAKKDGLSDKDMVKALVKDHEEVVRTMRKDIEKLEDELGDVGNADFVTGLMQAHEKMAWMLRSLLQQ